MTAPDLDLADLHDRLDAVERRCANLEDAVGRGAPARPSVSTATPLPIGWPTRKPPAPPRAPDLEDWIAAAETRTEPVADPHPGRPHARQLESLGRLVGTVAHDFNNLLTLICGYADLLTARTAPDDPAHDLATQIAAAGRTAAGFSRQLLELGRPAAASCEPLDLNAAVAGMEPLLRRVAGERVAFRVATAAGLPRVAADRTQVEQVLLNLVTNARDAFTEEKPATRQVTVRTGRVAVDPGRAGWPADRPGGEYAALSVTDNGCGIPDAVKLKVFDPYFSTKGAAGTGLGLATVRDIAREAGGHAEIESTVGWGTTVRVLLPVAAGEKARPSAATMLVVDGRADVRAVARRVLERAGYAVLDAANALDAEAAAGTHPGPVDLLVTDVDLPRVTGPQLADRLRQVRPGMRVLYVSGRPPADGVRAAFLPKPYTPERLVEAVGRALATRGP